MGTMIIYIIIVNIPLNFCITENTEDSEYFNVLGPRSVFEDPALCFGSTRSRKYHYSFP